jgi:hypothetical protein
MTQYYLWLSAAHGPMRGTPTGLAAFGKTLPNA